jgi:PAS domain S-box-containing protein
MKKAVVVLPLISLFLVSFSLPVHSNPVDDCIWQNLDDHGPIMLLIDPEKGSVEYGNQAAAAFFGYQADALAGLPLAELTAGSLDELAAIWEEALAQEENSFVLERRLASGETRAVEIYVYPYRLEGREMFFSIIHDITGAPALPSGPSWYSGM